LFIYFTKKQFVLKKIALFFDRFYIDAHACFTELAKQLVESGYHIDLYYDANPYNPPPVFFDDRIRLFQIPTLTYHQVEFWAKMMTMKSKQYTATVGTPINGAWMAYKVAKYQKIPMFYLADEIFDPEMKNHKVENWEEAKKRDLAANSYASATLALGENRFQYQKKVNGLKDGHRYFVLPNAWAGEAKKLRSRYFRDILGINDEFPIVLFIGTIGWQLAKQVFEETKSFGAKPYHIVFHGRSIGMMHDGEHPFIHLSRLPLPSYLLQYAVSSADFGLALYDKNNPQDKNNGWTGGKISTYLKSQLPLIAGNLDEFKAFEDNNIGVYWDGVESIHNPIMKAISKKEILTNSIPDFYKKNMEYSQFYKDFEFFLNSITK